MTFIAKGRAYDGNGRLIKTEKKSAQASEVQDVEIQGTEVQDAEVETDEVQDVEVQDAEVQTDEVQTNALPDGFPSAHLLIESGFTTLEAVLSASDQELLDVDGIGPSKLAAIRAAQE